jgi:uncharacterized integral membrane protein
MKPDRMSSFARGDKKMIARLVILFVVVIFFAVFIGLNSGNTVNISFGFYAFEAVPVFVILLTAFVLGGIATLAFTIVKTAQKATRKKRENAGNDAKKATTKESSPEVNI